MLLFKCGLFLSFIFALVVDTLSYLASFNFVILIAVYSSCTNEPPSYFMKFPKAVLGKKNL